MWCKYTEEDKGHFKNKLNKKCVLSLKSEFWLLIFRVALILFHTNVTHGSSYCVVYKIVIYSSKWIILP